MVLRPSAVVPVKCANAVMPVKGAGTMMSVISASAVYVGLLQEHIESENARLEREQQFWAKEIVVKIEYKYCPNLTIIDTPGGPWGSRASLCRHAAGCLCVALSPVSTATTACYCCQLLCSIAYNLETACCMQQSRLAASSLPCCLEQGGSASDMASTTFAMSRAKASV